jgi:hypothetical protein
MLEATGGVATAVINQAGAAENVEVVAATANRRVRIIAMVLSTGAGVTVNFHAGAGSLSGALRIAANAPMVCPQADSGWIETPSGVSLLLDCTAEVSGFVRYQIVN